MERASSLLWGMKLRIMMNINNSLTQFHPSIDHDHLRLVNSQIITCYTTTNLTYTFETPLLISDSGSDRNMTVIAVIISKESQENAASQNDPGPRLVLGCDVTKFF